MDKRIEEFRDERDSGNGWFVYLKPGLTPMHSNRLGFTATEPSEETFRAERCSQSGYCPTTTADSHGYRAHLNRW